MVSDRLQSQMSSEEVIIRSENLANSRPRSIDRPEGFLYVRQKQSIITYCGEEFESGQEIRFCGTGDLITCIAFLLHHEVSGVSGLGHFDEFVRTEEVASFALDFVHKAYEHSFELVDCDAEDDEYECNMCDDQSVSLEGSIEVHLVGGMMEWSRKCDRILSRLLRALAQIEESFQISFHIKTACIGSINTDDTYKVPRVRGICFDLNRNVLEKADFVTRQFVPDQSTVSRLLLGPALLKKRATLKQIVMQAEDKGFDTRRRQSRTV